MVILLKKATFIPCANVRRAFSVEMKERTTQGEKILRRCYATQGFMCDFATHDYTRSFGKARTICWDEIPT